MQQTSETYKRILRGEHYFDGSLVIGEDGRLVDKDGGRILFGGFSILVDNGGPESGYREDTLISVEIRQDTFSDDRPMAGDAISAELEVSMIKPTAAIPGKARVTPWLRAVNDSDAKDVSEWIKQGVFYVDSREQSADGGNFQELILHCYDSMILADADYPGDDSSNYPMLDIDMVRHIARNMRLEAGKGDGISVDNRTAAIMTKGYRFGLPLGYSMREVLQMIAGCYGGSFVISPDGELRLILLGQLPRETRVLIDNAGYQLVIGGVKILV